MANAFLLTFALAASLLSVGCESKRVVTPTAEGVSPSPNSQGGSTVVSPAGTAGEFFGSGQSVPAVVDAIFNGKKIVIFKNGVQRLCLNGLGPPCLGRIKLDSGLVRELGSSYVCRFAEDGGAVLVRVIDNIDSPVFVFELALANLVRLGGAAKELTSGSVKISLVSQCSL